MSGPKTIRVLDIGTAPYEEIQELQARLRRGVADGRLSGVLLLLEHPAVITLGKRAGRGDLRGTPPPGVGLTHTERGGAATLHAPGQLVSYPIVPLPGRDLRGFVRALEEVLIRVLDRHGVTATRVDGRPGLYVGTEKIASLGLRCERWVSSHGTSLNVAPDLDLFDLIVSCGEEGLRQTSMARLLAQAPPLSQVKKDYVGAFAETLPFALGPVEEVDWRTVERVLGVSGRPLADRAQMGFPF